MSSTKRIVALATLGANAVLAGLLAVAVLAIEVLPAEAGGAIAEFSQKLARFSTILLCLGALAFLPWLKATYRQAHELVPNPELAHQLRRGPVLAFFVPFLNLVWPYQAVRVLDAALDPDDVPAPEPRLAPNAPATYRDAAVEPVARYAAPPAPVKLWWALWIGRAVVVVLLDLARGVAVLVGTTMRGRAVEPTPISPNDFALPGATLFVAVQYALASAGAIAACVVVARISARRTEVARRLNVLAAARAEGPASSTSPYRPSVAGPALPEVQPAAGRDANWALGLAILSIFFCAPLTAPFALWKASRALRAGASGTATAAIVLAVVGLILSLFFWLLAIWQFLSPASPR